MAKYRLNERSRKFLREVGSIVLGVLIALAIGEVADGIRHRIEARRALAAVRADMIDNSSAFDLQPLVDRCAQRRLTELTAVLDAARQSGQLPGLGEIGTTKTRSYRSGTWESAVDNGDTLYLPRKLVGSLNDYHEGLRLFRQLQQDAMADWSRLSVLENAPGRIDDNTLSSARQTVAELRYRETFMTLIAKVTLEGHRALGFPVSYLTFNDEPWSRAEAVDSLRGSALCRPLRIGQP